MKMSHSVNIHPDAVMIIPYPNNEEDGGIEWHMRYGDPVYYRYIAASVIESYNYLLSSNITTKESIRRLRILRAEMKKLELPEEE